MPRLPASVLAVASLLALTIAANAAPPSTKTIRQWTAACDNLRSCSAFGFATLLDETMIGAWTRLDRSGEAASRAAISFAFMLADGDKDRMKSLTITAKGGARLGPYPVGGEEGGVRSAAVPAADLAAALRLLRSADFLTMTVATEGGDAIEATLSLDGASGALLFIDDEQQRVGTKTALVRPGEKPAAAVPPVPDLPVIRRAPPTGAVEQKLPAAILDLAKASDCADTSGEIEPIVADLGDGQMLYGALCSAGAYNFAATFWIERNGGPPVLASFPLPASLASPSDDGGSEEPGGVLVNPDFDTATMTMSSFAKGRGIGDCGSAGEWVFDGTAFRLASYRLMDECQGIPAEAWPVLFRATVK